MERRKQCLGMGQRECIPYQKGADWVRHWVVEVKIPSDEGGVGERGKHTFGGDRVVAGAVAGYKIY